MRISDEVVMKHYLYQQLWEQFEGKREVITRMDYFFVF